MVRADKADEPVPGNSEGMRLLLLALSCAVATACGTTVPLTQQATAPGSALSSTSPDGLSGSGSGAALGPGSGTTTGTAGGGGGASTGFGGTSGGATSGTGGGAGGSTGSGTSGGSSGGSTGGASGYGQGITATTVKVGIAYDPNLETANGALAQGLGSPSSRGMQTAYIDMLNSKGGLSGHKVEADFFQVNAASADDNNELSRACAHFTNDAKDFAVFGGRGNPYASCLDKGGVLPISSNLTVSTDEDFRQAPHYIEPSTLDLDRRGRNLPQALADQGWLKKGSVLGLISYDQNGFKRAVEKELRPRLSALGHTIADPNIVYVHYPAGYSDYGNLSSETASAVLRFNRAGVTHVLMLDSAGLMTLFFMQAAENQSYRPQYGLDTASGVQTLLEGGNISPNQAKNASGLGWVPGLDVPADKAPKTAAITSCLAFFTSKGFAAENNNARAIQLGICDEWDVLAASLAKGARNRDEAVATIEGLGKTLTQRVPTSASFSPGRHDGVDAYRYLRWDGECGCMSYDSRLHPTL